MSIAFQRRPALGLGLSLLAHAAVIAWLALRPASRPPPDAPAPVMQVRLVLQPVPRVQPPPISDPPPLPRASSTASARAAQHRAPAEAPPEAPQSAGPPATITLPAQDAPTAADAAPAQPDASFEMQAARGTARAWVKGEGKGRGGADGNGAPFLPSRDEKLGQAIERARPADCRKAYTGMGVLAVIPLAASAVTGKGCKW